MSDTSDEAMEKADEREQARTQDRRKPVSRQPVRVKAASGRPKNPTPLTRRTVEIPDDLWGFARSQPEGAALLIRGLLERERLARTQPGEDGSRTLIVPTRGGTMEAVAIEDGLLVLLEETLVLHYVHDVGRGFPVLHIPTRVEAFEQRKAQALERYQARQQAPPETAVAPAADETAAPDTP